MCIDCRASSLKKTLQQWVEGGERTESIGWPLLLFTPWLRLPLSESRADISLLCPALGWPAALCAAGVDNNELWDSLAAFKKFLWKLEF